MATMLSADGLDTSDATASASSIFNGKTAYVNGTKVTGTALKTASTATAARILNGYKAYNSSGTLLTGTALSTASTATASTILSGYKAYNSSGTLMTGTYVDKYMEIWTLNSTSMVWLDRDLVQIGSCNPTVAGVSITGSKWVASVKVNTSTHMYIFTVSSSVNYTLFQNNRVNNSSSSSGINVNDSYGAFVLIMHD